MSTRPPVSEHAALSSAHGARRPPKSHTEVGGDRYGGPMDVHTTGVFAFILCRIVHACKWYHVKEMANPVATPVSDVPLTLEFRYWFSAALVVLITLPCTFIDLLNIPFTGLDPATYAVCLLLGSYVWLPMKHAHPRTWLTW
ncbi:hypothetical protein C8Q80DRAFT_1267545 [Daedaleopsis nitida]|nr:hypothetical protein C8Q80DRAFT_1267545 [Daedaleopsis nitida]